MIAITGPGDQVAPPLMRRLMSRYEPLQQDLRVAVMQLFSLLITQERIRGQEDQPGPTLAGTPWQLGQSQMTIRKRAEAVGKILDGLRGLRHDHLRSPHRKLRRRSYHLNLPSWKIFLHTAGGVGLDTDITNASRGLTVLAEIEPGEWNGAIRSPPSHLLPVCLRELILRNLCRFSCRDQYPVLRITELQVEISHLHAAVRIPGPASANIQQSAALFLQNFSSVGKFQLELLTGSRGLWKYNRDHIVTSA